MNRTTYLHEAHDYTNEELLTALLAERLDRLADRMIARAHDRLAIFGRLSHTDWLHQRIPDLSGFPIVAYISPDTADLDHSPMHNQRPLLRIEDPRLASLADTILISDDRYEEALAAQALRWTPPGTIIFRLYERLAIGREPLTSRPRPIVRTRPVSIAPATATVAAGAD